MDDEERSSGNGLELVREALRRRAWLAAFTFGATFAAVLSLVLFLPDLYRSSATVLIDRQQIPDGLVKSTVSGDVEVRLQTISQEILSRSRLEALIQQLGLYTELKLREPMEKVVEHMQKHINLELKGSERRGDRLTVAFTLSFSGSDSQKVALVANRLASFYIEENLKVRERQAAGTADFLRVQLEQMKEKLQVQEQEVSRFKERHMGELPQQLEANLATLEQLSNQLRINSDTQAQVGERQAALAKQLEETEGTGLPSGLRATAERLFELKRQLAFLYTRYTDKYPDVVRLKEEIAILEGQLLTMADAPPPDARRLPVSPQVQQLRQDLMDANARAKGLQAEAERLRRTIGLYQARVENAPRREQEFQTLARDYETTKDLYKELRMRGGEADVGESMEQRQKGEQFRIIDPAVPAVEPDAPNRVQLIALGLLLSLGLMVGVVVLREQLDTSFHTADQLRSGFRDMALVSIPRIVGPSDVRARRRRMRLAGVAAMTALAVIVGGSYLLARPEGPLARVVLR